MVEDWLVEGDNRMRGAVKALEEDLAAIRTGRASPALVERLEVDYYGTRTPLQQIANISAPEPRLVTIKPFDPSTMKDIERAIQVSDLGLTPSNDGKIIRLSIPPLTEERRHELVKLVRSRTEEARVAVRNVRRDVQNELRDLEKEKEISEDELYRSEERLQKITDEHIEAVNAVSEKKEAEVLEV